MRTMRYLIKEHKYDIIGGLAILASLIIVIGMFIPKAESKADKASNATLKAALNGKHSVTYAITYIDQETSNKYYTDYYYSTDVIGYMKGDKEEQLRISLKDKMPNIDVTYKTTILTNFKAKPTVTIAHKDDAITVTVRRQPRQRYIQPNESETVTAKENK